MAAHPKVDLHELIEALQNSVPKEVVMQSAESKPKSVIEWLYNQSLGSFITVLGIVSAVITGYVTLNNRVVAQGDLYLDLKTQIKEIKDSIENRDDNLYNELKRSGEATAEVKADIAVIKNDIQTIKSQNSK